MKVISFFALLVGGFAAGASFGAGRVFSEAHHYQHPNFASLDACHEAQKHFMVNCFQDMTLLPDGTGELIVTDIVNIGRYSIEGDKLTFQASPSEEVSAVVFTLSSDEKTLTDPQGSLWSLVAE